MRGVSRTRKLLAAIRAEDGAPTLILERWVCAYLFDGNGLGEIARLIYIGALNHGHVVGQQL